MSRQARPAPAFPPTPEDETDMAQLHAASGRAMSTRGLAPVGLGQAGKDRCSVDNIANTPTSPSSSLALSRFEFEPGKGNEGTKVLMVEWDGLAAHSTVLGSHDVSEVSNGHHTGQGRKDMSEHEWVVTWEGKDSHNVLAASDNAVGAVGAERRTYFLLPPGATIPPLVSITRGSRSGVCSNGSEGEDATMVLWTKPMPAIYPASLGPDAGQAGGRGVLHTLWAKQRLAGLAAEIEAEMKANSESIGLQIALQEQDWVSENFGVGEPSGLKASSPYLPSPASPTVRVAMPRSPIGRKLGEKLKGLRLATSPAELAAALQVKTAATNTGTAIATCSAGAVDGPGPAAFGARVGLCTSIEPHMGVHSSLDAVISDSKAVSSNANLGGNVVDAEDGLFALPLSPRSPEMARSPFSLL